MLSIYNTKSFALLVISLAICQTSVNAFGVTYNKNVGSVKVMGGTNTALHATAKGCAGKPFEKKKVNQIENITLHSFKTKLDILFV